MNFAILPPWLQGFENERDPKARCLICWKICNGKEALDHTKKLGHNKWRPLLPKEIKNE